LAVAGRRRAAVAWPPGAQPVAGVQCAAAGIGAHRHARQRRGRLHPRGVLTLVNDGQSTTKRETATLSGPTEPEPVRRPLTPPGGRRAGQAPGNRPAGPYLRKTGHGHAASTGGYPGMPEAHLNLERLHLAPYLTDDLSDTQRLTRPLSSRSSNSSLASRFGVKIVDDFAGEGLGRGRTGRVPICSA